MECNGSFIIRLIHHTVDGTAKDCKARHWIGVQEIGLALSLFIAHFQKNGNAWQWSVEQRIRTHRSEGDGRALERKALHWNGLERFL